MTTEQGGRQGPDYRQGCGVSGDSCTSCDSLALCHLLGALHNISATVIYLVIFSHLEGKTDVNYS